MTESARLSMPWAAVTVVVLMVNTWATLSDRLVGWLSADAEASGETWIPAFVLRLIALRPEVGDVDLHVVIWAAAGFAATLAVRRTVPRIAVLGALWSWSLALEWLQPIVSDLRTAQVGDIVGNTIGLVLGACAGLWWQERRVPPWMRAVVVAVALATVAVAMWSTRMRVWWGAQSGLQRDPAVPPPLKPSARAVLDVRPDLREADVHAIVWFVVALIALWALGVFTVRARIEHRAGPVRMFIVIALLGVVGVVVELLQPVVGSRGVSSGDLLGNAVGLGAALAVGLAGTAIRRQMSGRHPHSIDHGHAIVGGCDGQDLGSR